MATYLRTSVRVFIVMAFAIGTMTPWSHAVKYAFVTSETTDGSIDEAGSAQGIDSANAICTRLARSAGSIIPAANKADPWLAWLSSFTSSPSTTFVEAIVPYVRTDGMQIAANWPGLTSGTLLAPLNLDETGTLVVNAAAWTGTRPDGSLHPATCGDWKVANSIFEGYEGTVGHTAMFWTAAGTRDCDFISRIYCFEQGGQAYPPVPRKVRRWCVVS